MVLHFRVLANVHQLKLSFESALVFQAKLFTLKRSWHRDDLCAGGTIRDPMRQRERLSEHVRRNRQVLWMFGKMETCNENRKSSKSSPPRDETSVPQDISNTGKQYDAAQLRQLTHNPPQQRHQRQSQNNSDERRVHVVWIKFTFSTRVVHDTRRKKLFAV